MLRGRAGRWSWVWGGGMTASGSPTVRRRRLAGELLRLREAAGLTTDAIAERMGWSASKVSRIETSRIGIRPSDLQRLLDVYAVEDPDRRADLLTLAQQAKQRGWWQAYGSALSSSYTVYIGLEAEAAVISGYEAQLVHGLLQTTEYARAVTRATRPTDNLDEVERRVAVRSARQALLTRDDPPHLWAVLDEAALRREVGGAAVMSRQLRHIAEVAEAPNVTVQVLPFSAGAHAGMEGAFALLQFPGPDPDVVYVEGKTTGALLEDPDDVASYSQSWEYLRAVALGPDESTTLITQLASCIIRQT